MIGDVVSGCGGTLVKSRGEGDSTFCVFRSAIDATVAAVAIVEAVERERWPTTAPIRVRVGVFTGEAHGRDGDYFGVSVNRAARLRSLACGGQILLGARTVGLVRGALPAGSALVDVGDVELRGMAEAEHVFELVRGSTSAVAEDAPSNVVASNLAWTARQAHATFVGRDEQVAALERSWDRAAGCSDGPSARSLVLLAGEPGIGKTTLAAHIARVADERGGLVLFGRWSEDAATPFQAFRDALEEYANACPAPRLRAEIGSNKAYLARVVPSAVAKLGPVASSPGDEIDRYQVFAAVDAWLRAIARRQPVLLVLDDLHWADAGSLRLLAHLFSTDDADGGILVVATMRDGDELGKELTRTLADIRRSGAQGVERIELGGLARDAVAALVAATAGRAVSPASTARVVDDTAGNPFFVEQLASHLSETADGAGGDVPGGVRDVVRWRIGRLSDSCARLLRVAAVAGRRFDLAVVTAVGEVPTDEAIDLLEEAERARLVRELDEADRFEFHHDVVRRTLLDELSRTRRARMHRRVGEVLEGRGSRATPAELAFHFGAAAGAGSAVAAKAIAYAHMAGEAALGGTAYETAIEHFVGAIDVIEGHLPSAHELRCDLLLVLAAALERAGQPAARDERCLEAAAIARELDRPDLLTRAALGYGGVLPAALAPDPIGTALVDEAIGRLAADDLGERALLLARRAHWMSLTAPRDLRRSWCAEAVALARRAGDPRQLAHVLVSRTRALDGPADVHDQLAAGDETLRIGNALGDKELVAEGLRARMSALFELGDLDAARDAALFLGWQAAEMKHPEFERVSAMWDAVIASVEGRFDDAARVAGELHARLEATGHPQAFGIRFCLDFLRSWLSGDLSHLVPLAASQAARDGGLLWHAVHAWSLGDSGESERAAELLAAVSTATVGRLERGYHWWAIVCGFVEATVAAADEEWAAFLYELALPYRDNVATMGLVGFYGAVDLSLGRLAAVLGRWDDAEDHLVNATARHESFAAPPFVELSTRALDDVRERRVPVRAVDVRSERAPAREPHRAAAPRSSRRGAR